MHKSVTSNCIYLQSQTKQLGHKATLPLPPLLMLIIKWFFPFLLEKTQYFPILIRVMGYMWYSLPVSVPTTFGQDCSKEVKTSALQLDRHKMCYPQSLWSPVRLFLAYFLQFCWWQLFSWNHFFLYFFTGISSDGINLLEKYVNEVNIFICFFYLC